MAVMKVSKVFAFLGISIFLVNLAIAPSNAEVIALESFINEEGQDCPEGEVFSPCTCLPDLEILCDKVSLETVQEIFNNLTAVTELNRLELIISPRETMDSIPANLLGDMNISTIVLSCPLPIYTLRIDPDALRSTAGTTDQLWIDQCDLSSLDFSFLTGFDHLSDLRFYRSSNLHLSDWSTLPPLSGLTELTINQCTDFDRWIRLPPPLINGLSGLYLHNNKDLNDPAVERILNWTIESADSLSTLRTMDLSANAITKIPEQIALFSGLEGLDASNNVQQGGIMMASNGSLSFKSSSPNKTIFIVASRVSALEEGTFQGDFSHAEIFLSNNEITRLEASVFQQVLEQMYNNQTSEPTGYLDVTRNPFDCEDDPCHLSWLIVDNRHLLDVLNSRGSVYCSNDTSFTSLDPEVLASECKSSASSVVLFEHITMIQSLWCGLVALLMHRSLY